MPFDREGERTMRDEERNYPARITLDADGFYRWAAEMDVSRKMEQFKAMLTTSALVSLVTIGIMAIISIGESFFTEFMLSSLGLAAGIVGLPALLWWLLEIKLAGTTSQKFEMNDVYVKHVGVSGKDTHSLDFKSVRKIRVKRRQCMIWVRGLVGGVQVFVPREDFQFALDYIRGKAGNAAVMYE